MDPFCRICARKVNPKILVSLFSKRKDEIIADMVVACTGLKVSKDDDLPKQLCPDCLKRLVDAFNLRKMIWDSHIAFKSSTNMIKTEQPDGETLIQSIRRSKTKSIKYPAQEMIASIETFERHKVIRLKGLRCCGCDEILASKSDLVIHSQQVHLKQSQAHSKSQTQFQCPTCFQHFETRKNQLNHTNGFNPREIYECTLTGILFNKKYLLLQHQNITKPFRQDVVVKPSAPAEQKHQPPPKRVAKPPNYPDAEFIVCVDEMPEYHIIHLGGERCCGCEKTFHDYQSLVDHCREEHPRKDDGEKATYECELCFKKFELLFIFNRHKEARVRKEMYYCQHCNVVSETKSYFERHLKTSMGHQAAIKKAGITSSFFSDEVSSMPLNMLEFNIEVMELDGFRCCGCEFVSTRKEELQDHSKEHHALEQVPAEKTGEYECEICFKRFSHIKLLSRHRNIAAQKYVYKCKLCDMQSNIRYRILQHLAGSAHQSKPKVYSCCFVKCKAEFDEPKALSNHVEETHAAKRRENIQERESDDYICNHCQKSFKSEHLLELHQFPKKPEAQYICTTCGASFASLSHLDSHEKMHTGIKDFICDVCNKRFYDESALKKHKFYHSEDKPYVCDVCSKSFHQKNNLKVHKRSHSDRIWKCPHCPNTYKTQSTLMSHVRTHRGDQPFACRFCSKRYSYSNNRNEHEMTVHTNERPYKCSQCDMTFVRKQPLVLHTRTHTGERPYSCQVCHRPFAQTAYLRKHMAACHREHGAGKIARSDEDPLAEQKTNVGSYEDVEMLEDVSTDQIDESEEDDSD